MLTNLSLVSVPLLSVLLTVSTITFQILSRSSKASSIFLFCLSVSQRLF